MYVVIYEYGEVKKLPQAHRGSDCVEKFLKDMKPVNILLLIIVFIKDELMMMDFWQIINALGDFRKF